ncbi:Uma2 family endonuclease [Aetokthonos hydrillicola Thurmond2011]|jgi:Uma2 family endonuclease|uniref:Uma2 family endonuclease n=1 Tax=Aetokthonos hydrillicola Thurmond2011 TaxID=2712845 RepID=A0AAP5MBK3_9CYAN|nr:Uma2 family endonuclease [Aetokthonos hydrillicola]MBO3463933.1 Uma2 family endonuclease [Aetokthonos hydrillicola CCALA 1050]MBW4588292.1 Uma2 family endonuclease [Aetokthonos hydrillicola CCALA 1050]MDR9897228.1 Uma2 family endonuclease [Aetokthonos hydrillicola Thurmond2011]
MYNYNPLECLPSSAELPDSDDTPVDSELQISLPNLLLAMLAEIWQSRDDWFFGINMGIYYTPSKPPIVPDGFLSLGVERFVGENGRSSYVLWEEESIPPNLALEVVSQTYNGEYEQKKIDYAELGILYYIIYAPTRLRRKRQRLEVYRLVNGQYILQPGDKVWMPEIGLGIGRERGIYQGITREWLFWCDEQGNRYPTPEEIKAEQQEQLEQSQQELEQTQQQLQELLSKLQQRGIDPNTL